MFSYYRTFGSDQLDFQNMSQMGDFAIPKPIKTTTCFGETKEFDVLAK